MRYILLLACFLVAGVALAEDKSEAVWFVPVSVMVLDSDNSTLAEFAGGPAVSFSTRSAYGLGAGLGYRMKNGMEFAGSLLHVKQEVDASWNTPTFGSLAYESNRMGLLLSVNIPLRFK